MKFTHLNARRKRNLGRKRSKSSRKGEKTQLVFFLCVFGSFFSPYPLPIFSFHLADVVGGATKLLRRKNTRKKIKLLSVEKNVCFFLLFFFHLFFRPSEKKKKREAFFFNFFDRLFLPCLYTILRRRRGVLNFPVTWTCEGFFLHIISEW